MKNFARSPRSIRGPAAAVAFMSDSFVAVPSLPSHVVHWFPTPTVSGFLPAQCCFHDDFCDYLFFVELSAFVLPRRTPNMCERELLE